MESEFWLYTIFDCVKRIGGKRKNYFHVEMGYCYSKEDKKSPINCFFFGVNKPFEPDRYEGPFFDKEFYDGLVRNVRDVKCVVWNPEEDETEGIEVRCQEVSAKSIDSAFSRFKTDVLKPFLKQLKFN